MGRLSSLGTFFGLSGLIIVAGACTAPDDMGRAKIAADAHVVLFGKDKLERRTSIVDAGNDWLVTYHLPDGKAGGDVNIWVNKKTFKIDGATAGQ